MAPRLTGTSPPATATALCTEAATAWRAAGGGAATQWGGQLLPMAVGKQSTQAEAALRVLALTAGTRGAGGICALRLLHSLCLHQGPCSFVRMGVRGHNTPQYLRGSTLPRLHPALVLHTGTGAVPWSELCRPGLVPFLRGFPLALGSVWGRCCRARGETPSTALPPQLHLCKKNRNWDRHQHPAHCQPPGVSVPPDPLLPLGKAPRRGRSREYRSRL